MLRQLPDITAETESTGLQSGVTVGEKESSSFKENLYFNCLPEDSHALLARYFFTPEQSYYLSKLTIFPNAVKPFNTLPNELLTAVIFEN